VACPHPPSPAHPRTHTHTHTAVALAGSEDFFYVSLGSILGHALCTAMAVVGGRLLASRISAKTVTLAGALLFFAFGAWSLVEAFYY
jgi:putative Ca2+/H+ antiporter (TMEM165/GDT1 family)